MRKRRVEPDSPQSIRGMAMRRMGDIWLAPMPVTVRVLPSQSNWAPSSSRQATVASTSAQRPTLDSTLTPSASAAAMMHRWA